MIDTIVLDTDEVMTCKHCKRTLPLEQFRKDRRAPNGHRAQCKECKHKYDAEKRTRERKAKKYIEEAKITAKPKDPKTRLKLKKEVSKAEQIRRAEFMQQEYDRRVSQARVNAIKKLVGLHSREFQRLLHDERVRLKVPSQQQWVSLTGTVLSDESEWEKYGDSFTQSQQTMAQAG